MSRPHTSARSGRQIVVATRDREVIRADNAGIGVWYVARTLRCGRSPMQLKQIPTHQVWIARIDHASLGSFHATTAREPRIG